jgi:signal transduction histidine kinase
MNKRRIIWYELLILVPTVVTGAALFLLLGHERERLDRAGLQAAESRAQLMAQSLDGAVAAIQDSYTAWLLTLPASDPAAPLQARADRDPLIRHVFIADPRAGLLLPAAGGRTEDETLFARRYDALFSGRDLFQDFTRSPNGAPEPAGSSLSRYNPLRDLAKRPAGRGLAAAPADSPAVETGYPQTGWMPWHWESRLHWLGWARPGKAAPVFGVELETAALLAYLLPSLQGPGEDGLVLVLRDGNGQPVHQRGAAVLDPGTPPLARLPVGPGLPHWTVEAYAGSSRAAALSGRLFLILSSLLTLIFLTALLAGGALLARQARRDRRDAETKTTFVSNVSHEFKTPLTTLRMYAELLAEDRVTEPAAIKRYLGVMIRETERLTRLVNNVLDFSRLEQGRRKLNPQPVDVAALALGLFEAQAPRLAEAGLALETAGLDSPAVVLTDRDALAQILLNLLDNAIKYAASGKRLLVTLNRLDGRTRLILEDRGPGIPPEHRGRLFEPFHRVDEAITATQPGTGLGLSISRRLLRDMGGDLIFEPAAGGGARFILELPDENQNHPDR